MTDEWECFSDPAYYDMWCVRQVGSRTFGEGFHLVNGDEAKMLCRFLNTRPADRIEAQAERVKAMEEALERSREGWENAIELGLIPERHRNTALILAEDCRAALRTARETNDA